MRKDDRGHVGELLDAWRTGELEPAEGARVEAHLAECERCRAELSALEILAIAVERGQEARRRSAAELEPDWAAQRAAIVARTSGRPRAARGGRRAFWRWAPQVALAAVAVIVIGVVWRGTTPDSAPESARLEAPEDAADDGAEGFADGREADVRDQAATPPPAAPEREALEEARAKAELGRQAEPAGQEPALADRFERAARLALVERDTLAARRALSLWSDTLAPRLDADEGGAAALADSLEEMLEGAE
ncbi:MAG TPA: zf-HC2 domain-containing protein [Gemmatimonadota bacterium]|nr:zf-HC2 domain-containing protein [Gemmatimonadota bacterium]